MYSQDGNQSRSIPGRVVHIYLAISESQISGAVDPHITYKSKPLIITPWSREFKLADGLHSL
jgi:hypothetical protein